jgi:anti-sigma-K factor RskA
MNIQEYIESGILEEYVIGSLSASEIQEVEKMISQYPELKNEVTAIENAFLIYAKGNAVKPALTEDHVIENVTGKPASNAPQPQVPDVPVNTIMDQLKKWLPWLILVPVALGFLYKSNKTNEAYTKLDQSYTEYKIDCEKTGKQLEAYKQFINQLMDPTTTKVNLKGTAVAPNAYATVLLKKDNKILISADGLPQPPSDKQYQLWALKDGKPIDMGVLATNDSTILEIANVQGAQAYAITLEKAGGSPTPTMESMYVMGGI